MILISFEEAAAYLAYRARQPLTHAQIAAIAKLDKRCLDHKETFGAAFAAYERENSPKEPA